mmetsp:Transcript_25427/g.35032  ORF Transcript_25427/g.35032 Transcript_25427/m.35032 type:complete len:82 (-) Transcript_25427:104-349(-)
MSQKRPMSVWEAQHYERLERGRKRESEIKRVLNLYDGSKWRGEVTKPMEFSFSNKYKTDIKCLKQPVSCNPNQSLSSHSQS